MGMCVAVVECKGAADEKVSVFAPRSNDDPKSIMRPFWSNSW